MNRNEGKERYNEQELETGREAVRPVIPQSCSSSLTDHVHNQFISHQAPHNSPRDITVSSIKHLPNPHNLLRRSPTPRRAHRLPPPHPCVILPSMISALFDQKFRRVPCADTARVFEEDLCLSGVHFTENDNVVWVCLCSG